MGFTISSPDKSMCRFIHLSKTEDETEKWINIDDISSVYERRDESGTLVIRYISRDLRGEERQDQFFGERANELRTKLQSISC
jgi:hypothetical protein